MNEKDENWSNLRGKLYGLKGLALIGSADVIGGAISAIFWLVIASLLLVEEYGELSYFRCTAIRQARNLRTSEGQWLRCTINTYVKFLSYSE